MNNIPQNIIDIIDKMNDPNTNIWIRDNYRMTLESIIFQCQKNVNKFLKDRQKEIKKK